MTASHPKRLPPDPLPVELWLRQFPGVEGFLHAIAEEPWDDTHRLILADWLDDRGASARAEFLRLQCQHAGRELWEISAQANHRERQLRAVHWVAWHQGLPEGVRFSRGLAVQVNLTPDNDTARLNEAARTIDLQEIVWPLEQEIPNPFDGVQWARLLAWCPALRSVTGISLRLPTRSTNDIVRELVQSPHLRSLSRIRIAYMGLPFEGLSTLLESPLLAGPYELDLRGHSLGTTGAEMLACWPGLAALSVLGLSDTMLGEAGIRTLVESPYFPNLTQLNLHQTEARIATGEHLAAMAALARLTSLDLSVNLLRDEGSRALAGSPYLARLAALNLRDNQIGSAGGKALAESPYLPNLRVLDLGNNSVGLAVRRQLHARWPFVRF